MKTLQFKTSINCAGCVAKVAPLLDKLEAVAAWSVDTAVADKILTVETSLSQDAICSLIDDLGFDIKSCNS